MDDLNHPPFLSRAEITLSHVTSSSNTTGIAVLFAQRTWVRVVPAKRAGPHTVSVVTPHSKVAGLCRITLRGACGHDDKELDITTSK